MTARVRSAALALLAALACLTTAPAQIGPIAPEPPVAGVPTMPPLTPPAPAASFGSACPVDPPTPVVNLRVRVPASSAPNQEIEYRITAENRSQADAHHVTVRAALPTNARLVKTSPESASAAPDLSWSLGTLTAGATREIVVVLTPTAPGDVSVCARVQFEHGQCVTTRIEKPAGLSVRKFGPAVAGVNEVLSYRIIVSNRGTVALTGVGLIDKLPEGLEHASGKATLAWTVGRLGPGEARTVDYQVTARKAGRLCNRVAASGDGGLLDEAESCVVVGGQPGPGVAPPGGAGPAPAAAPGKLSLTMTGPPQRFVNRPATFQITVTNAGPGNVSNVVITDVLPPQTTLVSASDNGRLTGNQVQWLIGTLRPGTRRTVLLALQAQAAGAIVNRATATGEGGQSVPAESKTLFEGATGLTFDLDVKDSPLEVGGQTSFIVTVLNQGTAPANKVRVSVTLPDQVQVIDASGPAKYQQQGQQVTFEPLDGLRPQAEVRYQINVKALREGDGKARAELRGEAIGDRPVLREHSITIFADGASIRPQPVPGK
jgi:uncharacterized repeat protein (TIGR01451 family)